MSSIPVTAQHGPEVPGPEYDGAEYAWEVATLYPQQGEWSEEDYLKLTDHWNRRIEFTDGRVEFLSPPTLIHETLTRFLFLALYQFVDQRKLGKVFSNGIRLRIRPRKVRLPDVIFLRCDHFHALHNRGWDGADLVMEVVGDSPGDRQRDYEEKLIDYAEAKIAEYWIIDPQRQVVLVHSLAPDRYSQPREYGRGQIAVSTLLEGFGVDVGSLFAAAENIPE